MWTRAVSGAVALFLLTAESVRAECKLFKLGDLPITMLGLRPTTTVKINGEDVRLLVDSGAAHSIISTSRATELRLHTEPMRMFLSGIGGIAEASVATVKLTLSGVTIPRIEFIVAGVEPGEGSGGLIGQNILRAGDVEYDLAGGMIRLLQTRGCRDQDLAYWTKTQGGSLPVEWSDAQHPHTIGVVVVNGVKIRATFDTGASTSILNTRAAVRAGIKLDSPEVAATGFMTGVGSHAIRTWIAPVKTFAIGDEEIRTTRLQIGDIASADTDMLIGADFFLSHRVYVSNTQRRLYFTYNGGAVFNLEREPTPVVAAASPLEQAPVDASRIAPPTASPDAEAFSRQGAALTSRRDYAGAVAQFDHAVALAPHEARYLVERAQARIDAHQPFLAMTDIDAAIALKPDDVDARMMRAELRLRGHDLDGARIDLDAVAATLSTPSDVRLRLAGLYDADEQPEAAVAQYSRWLSAHADDGRRAVAFNGRCFARAQLGSDLDKALKDCDAALRQTPGEAEFLDSRGLVHLRRAEYAKAISDYDAALRVRPKIAWSLYGRGVAKTRLGQTAEGQTDIAAATTLAPELPARAKALGITP